MQHGIVPRKVVSWHISNYARPVRRASRSKRSMKKLVSRRKMERLIAALFTDEPEKSTSHTSIEDTASGGGYAQSPDESSEA